MFGFLPYFHSLLGQSLIVFKKTELSGIHPTDPDPDPRAFEAAVPFRSQTLILSGQERVKCLYIPSRKKASNRLRPTPTLEKNVVLLIQEV
jgi:hypothetical protein